MDFNLFTLFGIPTDIFTSSPLTDHASPLSLFVIAAMAVSSWYYRLRRLLEMAGLFFIFWLLLKAIH